MTEQQEKERFFALYWGQEVYEWEHPGHAVREGVTTSTPDLSRYVNSMFLNLKHLSAITDEDAIEVASYLSNGMSRVWTKGYKANAIFGFNSKIYGEVYLFNDLSFGGHEFEGDLHKLPIVIDYLRSLGYALPWLGISVEEQIKRGWIKIIES